MPEREPFQGQVSMSLGQHLDELRRRLIHAIFGLVPIFIASLFVGNRLLDFLVRPALARLEAAGLPAQMQATGPLETLNAYFLICLVITVMIGAPWVLYQLWKFVSPGLYAHEKRFIYLVIPLSTALVAASVLFLFHIVLPMILGFLVTFGSEVGAKPASQAPVPPGVVLPQYPVLDADPPDPAPGQTWINRERRELRTCVPGADGKPQVMGTRLFKDVGVRPEYRVSEYVKLLMALSLAFAGGFQAPVVVLLLGWVGIVNPPMLRKFRKHAVLACAVLAALLTPGDVGSMVAMMVPLYLLFELGIILLVIFPAKKVAGGLWNKERPRLEEE